MSDGVKYFLQTTEWVLAQLTQFQTLKIGPAFILPTLYYNAPQVFL